MRASALSRVIAFPLAAVLAPLLLTQCKTTGGTYKDISYDPAKLKTPAGHGMERNDYPFDEQGNYRKDWVKSNASGRDHSASPGAPAPVVAETGTEAETTPTGPVSYPTYAQASAARGTGAVSVETAGLAEGAPMVLASAGAPSGEVAAAEESRYHKVNSGDTLFSLASRYQTSVTDLKRVNGLTGDSIRVGQSLRIP